MKKDSEKLNFIRYIDENSVEGIFINKEVSKYIDSMQIQSLRNLNLLKLYSSEENIDEIYNKIKNSLTLNSNLILSEKLQEQLGKKSEFYKKTESFLKHMEKLSLAMHDYKKNIEDELKKLPKSSGTKNKGCFDYKLKEYNLTNPKLHSIKETQRQLRKKLNRNKSHKFKDSENIEMSYQFASNLNECFLYFNNILINVSIVLGDKSPSLYGAKEDENSNNKINNINSTLQGLLDKNDTTNVEELQKIQEFLEEFKKKINEHIGADGNANNVQKIIKKVIENENDEENIKKLYDIKNYFSILEVIVRNFYSHGWLDIFPLISLKTTNLYPILNLGYHFDNDKQIKIHINIFDDELYVDSLNYLAKQKGFDNMVDINNNISQLFDTYTLDTELTRSFLRRVSTSCVKNIVLKEFPEEIIVYGNLKEMPKIILSEEEIFKKINIFLEILDHQKI